jgi:hypothetical protein
MSMTKKCDSGVFFKEEMRNCTAGKKCIDERSDGVFAQAGTVDVKHEIFVMKFVLGGFGKRISKIAGEGWNFRIACRNPRATRKKMVQN